MEFRFALPQPPSGPLVEMTFEETERMLLKRLEAEKDKPIDALWQLARLYQQSKQIEKGLACLERVLAEMPDAEGKASAVLGLGQMMESAQDFQAAVRYYKEAFALEPVQTDVWYFINNNLGYSLNQLGDFVEGAKYCRAAIQANAGRPNAFKNLGIALQGLGELHEAARCFVTATRVDAADPRSFHLLEKLLKEHPELEFEFQEELEACGKAVEFAAQRVAERKPVIYRGWRKHLALWSAKITRFFSRNSANS